MAATLTFKEIKTISIPKRKTLEIGLDKSTVWKIESAGIGGTSGSLVVNDSNLKLDGQIAILYSIVDDKAFGSPLPYWLSPEFRGNIFNDSSFSASVSITVYEFSGIG